ncbi:MAG: hypothetical protein P8K08_23755 [Fuerstiella sp.]|jgi:hypothetical protein|nr:hypothetical protein [Fuerstiella sp.]
MLDTPTQHQYQLWVLQRLHRICLSFRSSTACEPCLEQYEQQIQLVMDDNITHAATAWIKIIVQSLRTGTSFVPEEYMGTG